MHMAAAVAVSPLALFPTSALVALATSASVAVPKVSARQRIVDHVTKRDGAVKLAFTFKWFTPKTPITAYGVTFGELVNDVGVGVQELIDEGLIESWMDCVQLKITLEDVIPPRGGARYDRCNVHLLKRLFGLPFGENMGKDPLKFAKRSFAKIYAAHLSPPDFGVLKLDAEAIGAWLLEKQADLVDAERANLHMMLTAATPEQWQAIGLPYTELLAASM